MLSIHELDPFDDAQLRAFHAAYLAAETHGRRYASPWAYEEMAAMFRAPSAYVRRVRAFARLDDTVVAIGAVDMPLRDNTSVADILVEVVPDCRRRGIGGRLRDHLVDQARAHDRTVLGAWIPGREADAAAGTRTPGELMALAMGMDLRLLDVQRRLRLPVPAERLARLEQDAAQRAAGYGLLNWVDPCPDEHVAAYCALKAAMNTEAPTGGLDVEDQHWDEARLREEEQVLRDAGRTRYVVVAVAADGTLAGHNELVVPAYDPGVVYQWDTLVLPAHRGHRLGLALKVANLRTVQDAHPERSDVRTFNADANTHMVAVNEAIGFEAVEYMGEWQGPVPA